MRGRGAAGWHWLLTLCLALTLGAASLAPNSFAPDLFVRPALGQAATGATLSVLSTPVDLSVGGAAFGAARDGSTLKPGDRVRTGSGGVALITFFDGSETQLTPDTQVEIKQADSTNGPRIGVTQIVGTTVDRVTRLASGPTTNFSTDSPAATAVVRGTRYVLTTKCYAAPPPQPSKRLLVFPRSILGSTYLLADLAVYDDGGTLWEARAWQDPATGDAFDTYDQIGATFPEQSESLYQEEDGAFWLDREWQDPATGETWHTYENVGVPVDDQRAASLPPVQIRMLPMAQAQGGCHPVTSIVVVEGRVGVLPTAASLSQF